MNKQIQSASVRNEVTTMQANTKFTDAVYSKQMTKDRAVILGFILAAAATLTALSCLGLIPKY